MNSNDLPQAIERLDATETQKLSYQEALEQIEIIRSRIPNDAELGSVSRMAHAARSFIGEIMLNVPNTKEREIAINNTISAMLWSKHGILRSRVEMGVGEPPPLEGLPPFQPSLSLTMPGMPTFVQQGTDTVPEFTPVRGAKPT